MSDSEARLHSLLEERNVSPARQVAVGPYNVDFAIDGTAIEVNGGAWHSVKSRRTHEASRLNYILDNGWNIIVIWDTTHRPIDAGGADKVASLLQFIRDNPTHVCQYWVVRGDGQLATFGCGNLDQSALVLPLEGSAKPPA